MTPLEANGQNGGAGVVAVSLLRHLSTLAPEMQFTLLTSEGSHGQLVLLDAPNVRRRCVRSAATPSPLARRMIDAILSPPARVRLKQAYRSMRNSAYHHRLAQSLKPSLLFCPFTVSEFRQPGTPCISIIYDLQHVSYPQFFTADQRLNRQCHIAEACTRSTRVVCISEYVRGTLLAGFEIAADRVRTIPLGLLRSGARADASVVGRLGVRRGGFLLYPANFWPHKNHRVLFEALSIFIEAHPDSPFRLVCTGAPNTLMRELQVAAESMLPSGTVVFAGYLPDEELAGLLTECSALIFPSLYEGFGLPVLEAMASGKPVLCSNVTSLPEVAGDAAVYFDPTSPRAIAEGIEALSDRDRIAQLVRQGRARAETFGDGQRMASEYLALLRTLLLATSSA